MTTFYSLMLAAMLLAPMAFATMNQAARSGDLGAMYSFSVASGNWANTALAWAVTAWVVACGCTYTRLPRRLWKPVKYTITKPVIANTNKKGTTNRPV